MDARKTLIVTSALTVASAVAFAAPLPAPLTFVGITPCRIIETRTGQGFTGSNGPPSLVANTPRTFQITGTVTGLPAQCGVPDTALAVSVNFTVTGFASAGDIRVYPAGSATPLASIVNYRLENIANATTVPLGPSGGGHNGIAVLADAAATDFIADVNGYYLLAGILASGETRRGDFAFAGVASAAGQVAYAHIGFSLPSAPSAPTANFIPPGGASTVNCPGTFGNPQAAPGQLCGYAHFCGNSGNPYFTSAVEVPGAGMADPYGAFIIGVSAAAGQMYCYGTWAVTAP